MVLKEESVSWALSHGLMVSGGVAPITLLPSSFSRPLIERALDISPIFNELVHQVSLNTDFIQKTLHSVDHDQFTKNLLEILSQVTSEGVTQPIGLGIHRSDYMLHRPAGVALEDTQLYQVEINTISSAFPSLSTLTSTLHRYLIERHSLSAYDPKNLFPNNSRKGVASALAHAKSLYPASDSVIMMVVNSSELNSTDQRLLEYQIWEDHRVSLIRRSLTDIGQRATLDPTTKTLSIDGMKVAVSYFRSGYKPEDYPTDLEWKARLTIERSNSIKCPNINYHLVGTKKMQQVLAGPGVIEKFLSTEKCQKLRQCFTGLYSLDPTDSPQEIIAKVLSNPDAYVMKPQREGGGNLLHGPAMVQALQTMSPEEKGAYIIMDKIVPPAKDTWVILKSGQLALMDAISEIGTYGVYIGDDKKTYLNECVGTLVRTKSRNDADGGVCAGVAVLDTIYLV
uniref:Glutathione synthetase n=1 Tax=Arcella intermedia TaxID=1963864 RepID=A0A6B2L3P6_9EUKA